MKNFIQSGNSLTVTATAQVTAGKVVKVGNLLGVAANDAAIGETFELQFGVYTAPKVSAAVIAIGESLTWDVSAASGAGEFDDNAATPATGDVTGAAAVAWEAAGAGVTSLAVKFTGVPGTVTA